MFCYLPKFSIWQVCSSNGLFVPQVCSSDGLSVCLYLCVCLLLAKIFGFGKYVHLTVCLLRKYVRRTVCLSVCIPVCLSVCISVCLSVSWQNWKFWQVCSSDGLSVCYLPKFFGKYVRLTVCYLPKFSILSSKFVYQFICYLPKFSIAFIKANFWWFVFLHTASDAPIHHLKAIYKYSSTKSH